MTEYNATQSKYRDRCKDRIQRQLEISACAPPLPKLPALDRPPPGASSLEPAPGLSPVEGWVLGSCSLHPTTPGPLPEQEVLSLHSWQDYHQRRAGRHVGKREAGHLH